MEKGDRLSLLVDNPSFVSFAVMTILQDQFLQENELILRDSNMPLSLIKHSYPKQHMNQLDILERSHGKESIMFTADKSGDFAFMVSVIGTDCTSTETQWIEVDYMKNGEVINKFEFQKFDINVKNTPCNDYNELSLGGFLGAIYLEK